MEPGGGSDLEGFVAAWRSAEALRVELARWVRAVEVSGSWATDGSATVVAWVRRSCRTSHAEAARLVGLGRFLERYGCFDAALESGSLALAQVEQLRAVPARLGGLLSNHGPGLVSALSGLDVDDSATVVEAWVAKAAALVDEAAPCEPERSLSVGRMGGSTVGRFVLGDAGGSALDAALRTASSFDGPGDRRSPAERRADALVAVCAFFNAHHDRPATPRHRPHVELVEPVGELGAAHPVGTDADGNVRTDVEAQLCDCVLHRVAVSGDLPVAYGRAVRSVPAPMWRLVALRDGGCRFPGCGRPVAWCEAHHVVHWRHHGLTEPENLVLLCSHHHHLVHRAGWSVVLHPNGDLEVTRPDGAVMVDRLGHRARAPGWRAA